MNQIFRLFHISFVLFGLQFILSGQDCGTCYMEGDCKTDLQRGYKTYSQSKGFAVTPRDTVVLNVVFYGQKDYIFTFCTDKDLYPIHFWIIDPESQTTIYDNEEDRYLESLSIGFDITRKLIIKINTRGGITDQSEKRDYSGCLGVLFQYKNS